MSLILHIATSWDWDNAQEAGVYTAASLDTEGFIHGSAVEQLVETANLYYHGQQGLKLLIIDQQLLDVPVRYETPAVATGRDPNLRFPHIYGPIPLEAVLEAVDFPPSADGSFSLPDLSSYFPTI